MKIFLSVASVILAFFFLFFTGCVGTKGKIIPQFHSSIKKGDMIIAESVPIFYSTQSGYFAVVDDSTAGKIISSGGGKFSVPVRGAGGTLWVWSVNNDTLQLTPKEAFLDPEKRKEKYSRQID